MKIRKSHIALTIIFIGVCISALFYIFHVRNVQFEFVSTMPMKGNTNSPSTFYYAPSEEWFRFWVCDSRTHDSLPPLIEAPDLSAFQFEKYDYLLFKGKKLKALSHSPWLTHTEDLICSHEDPRTPLIPTLEGASIDTLYIYRIEKTNKFRTPGP